MSAGTQVNHMMSAGTLSATPTEIKDEYEDSKCHICKLIMTAICNLKIVTEYGDSIMKLAS